MRWQSVRVKIRCYVEKTRTCHLHCHGNLAAIHHLQVLQASQEHRGIGSARVNCRSSFSLFDAWLLWNWTKYESQHVVKKKITSLEFNCGLRSEWLMKKWSEKERYIFFTLSPCSFSVMVIILVIVTIDINYWNVTKSTQSVASKWRVIYFWYIRYRDIHCTHIPPEGTSQETLTIRWERLREFQHQNISWPPWYVESNAFTMPQESVGQLNLLSLSLSFFLAASSIVCHWTVAEDLVYFVWQHAPSPDPVYKQDT